MYVKRILEGKLLKYLGSREILAVTGPRQCGKTTLLKHIFNGLKNAFFLDFEDREVLELFDEDIKSFAELYVKPYKYLFIDEFQYAKEGGRKLKYLYDTYSTKILITGSSASALSIQSMKFLAGRLFAFNLYPFSFEECLSYKDAKLYELYEKRGLADLTAPVIKRILTHFYDFCVFGGYPRVALSNDREEKETVLRGIYNTYFLREVKEILNLPEDHKLSKLISALALQIGNVINYNELSDISGFRHKELLSYMNVLEKTFITVRGLPFYTNKRTELVKSPKIFFLDSGLRNFIVKNLQSIEKRQDKGALYENFVASELLKNGIDVRFWRTKSKAEVDFVIEKKGGIMPVEVKSDIKQPKISKSFFSFTEKYKPKKGFILSEKILKDRGRVKFAPIFSIGKVA